MRWEYSTRLLTSHATSDEFEEVLNDRGKYGWELVTSTVLPSVKHRDLMEVRLIFKRPEKWPNHQ